MTGASNGLGAALAIEHAGPGTRLLLIGRDEARLTETAELSRGRGASCELEVLDVRDTVRLLSALTRWDEAFRIDRAILNAGIVAGRGNGAEGEEPDEILAQVDTNLRATLVAANHLLVRMAGRRAGQIAIVSSLNALYPVPEAPTYSATKAALAAYVEASRRWAADFGVRLSLILPGFVRTGFSARYSGRRPFELSAEAAAGRIRRGLDLNRPTIAFPWPLAALIALSRVVPRSLQRRVLRNYAARLGPLSDQSDFSKIR